jgi:polar amino acid transport system substrate-binding protein
VRRPTTARVVAGALATVTALLLSGCGTDPGTASVSAATRATRVDRSLHDLLPQTVLDAKVLRVGTDASYAPMSSFGSDGRTIVGVEPDLGAELGRVLGIEVRFEPTSFTAILPAVAAGDLDLGISAITDTAARERTVDFVNYFSAGTSIVVQRGNPAGVLDIADLCGKTVAVEKGTTQVDLLARAQRNCTTRPIDVATYSTNSDALVQLRTGRAVAVLNDLSPAVALVTDRRTKSQYQLVSTTQYEPGLYGVAVARDQRRLRDAVRGALEKLVDSGSYASILKRWSVGSGAVERISVNSDR